jgi:hypothetical protein
MKQDQSRWETLRRDGGFLLPPDFASRVMRQAQIKQRRAHAVRMIAGAITLFLAGAASTRWIVNSVIDQNQGAVQKLTSQDRREGAASGYQSGLIADNELLLESVSRILFPSATADLGSSNSSSGRDLEYRSDSDDQDDVWAQDSACGGDAKCLAYYAANFRSVNNQEIVW